MDTPWWTSDEKKLVTIYRNGQVSNTVNANFFLNGIGGGICAQSSSFCDNNVNLGGVDYGRTRRPL